MNIWEFMDEHWLVSLFMCWALVSVIPYSIKAWRSTAVSFEFNVCKECSRARSKST